MLQVLEEDLLQRLRRQLSIDLSLPANGPLIFTNLNEDDPTGARYLHADVRARLSGAPSISISVFCWLCVALHITRALLGGNLSSS